MFNEDFIFLLRHFWLCIWSSRVWKSTFSNTAWWILQIDLIHIWLVCFFPTLLTKVNPSQTCCPGSRLSHPPPPIPASLRPQDIVKCCQRTARRRDNGSRAEHRSFHSTPCPVHYQTLDVYFIEYFLKKVKCYDSNQDFGGSLGPRHRF